MNSKFGEAQKAALTAGSRVSMILPGVPDYPVQPAQQTKKKV